LEEEKSLKQRMDFQQSQCKKALKLWLELEEEGPFETTDGFPTILVQKSGETMARFGREKSLKQRMDFQQSQCKEVLKLWLDLKRKKV